MAEKNLSVLREAADKRRAAVENTVRQQILSDHEMGLVIANNYHGNARQAALDLGMTHRKFLNIRRLVRGFGEDKEALNAKIDEWLATKPKGLYVSTFLVYANLKTTLYKPRKYDDMNIIQHINNVREQMDTNPQAYSLIHKLRILLLNDYSLRSQLLDRDYLSYSPCCACGSYDNIPPQGYKLVEIFKMRMPICSKCVDTQHGINWKAVAEMYFNYARNLEYVFDQINEA